ncbi:MAG: glycosyltransferase family 2 protein [Nitrospirae bacterium]|nr:glycosyltransferase family 2 protein [Nitrospirota bacterium]
MDLSVVVPIFNELENVEPLYYSIRAELRKLPISYEIIFVDDGSDDGTREKIREMRKTAPDLRLIALKRNFGQTEAMAAGFDNASGRYIITMDGDLQNDPSDIPVLLEKIREGYDVVSGWRKDRKDTFLRTVFSRMANFIISLTTGIKLHDHGCTIKVYEAACIKSLSAYGEMHRFFPVLASMTGARVTEIPVKHRPRTYGASKYGFDRVYKVFMDIFSINLIIRFSSTPLKGFVFLSIPFLLLTFCFCILTLLAWTYDWTYGKVLFFMIASVLNVIAAMHLVMLGILGEVVVRNSDLSHTRLPEITRKSIPIFSDSNE